MPKLLPDEAEHQGRRKWAERLGELLTAHGRNRQWLAREIGVSRAQLDKYANGTVTPPGKHLGAVSDLLGFDMLDQLERLGWLGTRDAHDARARRAERRRMQIHHELQRLVNLDAELHGVRPAMAVLDPLLRDGWTVRCWVDWRGHRRRMSYLDLLELTPPDRLRPLAADLTPAGRPAHDSRSELPTVDEAAYRGLTRGEQRLREIVESVIGADVFHRHECYWSERERHAAAYRGRVPATHPGLVLAVPWFLRRRHAREEAAPLVPPGDANHPGFTNLAVVGLPFSGAPDVAALLADEILDWGYAGVAMLTRERSNAYDRHSRGRLEQETARLLANGSDPRSDLSVWFYNEPEALLGSVDLLATNPNPPAVLHLRFSDAALREFLLPEWGGVPGREAADLFGWRAACDAAERTYRAHRPDDWHTIDVELTSALRGYDGEDARSDLYLVDFAGQAEEWLAERYGRERPAVSDDERPLLEVLARSADAELSDAVLADTLGITNAAVKRQIENMMTVHRIGTREDLYAFARWQSPR